jgi:hypothetical protein
MIKAFTNHHLNSSEITTLSQINMIIFLTSKVDFSTSPSNEKFASETRWPIRNSVFENIDNMFLKFVQGHPLLEMCHFAENSNNDNTSTMTTIDYLLSLVLTELHTAEQYQTAKSCLLLLSSLLLQSGNTQSRACMNNFRS